MIDIRIAVEDISLCAELNDTKSAKAIADVLPFEASANVWGDEIYFEVPVRMQEDPEACADVEIGTLAYWPPGNAFCIFYGPTPASVDSQPRAYSPVNIVGHVSGDVELLRSVRNGENIRVKFQNDVWL